MSDGASAGDGNRLAPDGGRSDAAHPDVSLEIDPVGVELKSVIVPQDFLPGLSSDWARLRFAGLERGKELVVGKMVGVVNSAEERAPSIEGGWRGKARSIIRLHGSFEMTARLDADELTRAFDRDPKLANAQGWASEQARYPGLVEYRISACDAILPLAFTRHAATSFRRGRKEARIRYRRLPLGDRQDLVIVEPVRMADRVVGRGSGFQDEGRTADDDIAARGFAAPCKERTLKRDCRAALRSPLTRSARAPRRS